MQKASARSCSARAQQPACSVHFSVLHCTRHCVLTFVAVLRAQVAVLCKRGPNKDLYSLKREFKDGAAGEEDMDEV